MYEIHPLTEITKTAPKWDHQLLIDSIRHRGLTTPITLYDGKILDGVNRYAACVQLGIEPKTNEYVGNDPVGFLLRQNINQLTTSIVERGIIANKAATIPRGGNQYNSKSVLSYSTNDAANALGISRDTVIAIRTVLRHGTQLEIAGMMSHEAAPGPLAKAIRRRIGPEKLGQRDPQHNVMSTGKNRQRHENMKIGAVLWGDLREALDRLTGLPNPAEVAQLMSRSNKTTEKINEKLNRSLEWLKDFNNAWDDIQNEKSRSQNNDNNSGGRSEASGAQHTEPPPQSGSRREDCSPNLGW